MFYVYIIYSDKLNKYYTGSCDQLDTRLEDHNSGRSTYTKSGKPWILKYSETFDTRIKARARESEIKRKKSRKYIEYLISSAG
tara:strand:- start:269 stop:517 length:249 start_codon:yes stop_codon:yes gene_type:complete